MIPTTELSDSDFELAIDEDIEVEDESGSEVVAVDEDEDSSDDFDEPSEEYESEVDIEPVVVAPQEAPWGGLWVSFLSVTTIVLVVVMMMMYEITRNAWSYNQPYPLTATIIDNLYQLGQSAGLMP